MVAVVAGLLLAAGPVGATPIHDLEEEENSFGELGSKSSEGKGNVRLTRGHDWPRSLGSGSNGAATNMAAVGSWGWFGSGGSNSDGDGDGDGGGGGEGFSSVLPSDSESIPAAKRLRVALVDAVVPKLTPTQISDTSPAIPEPGAALLFAAGLVLVAQGRRRT